LSQAELSTNSLSVSDFEPFLEINTFFL